MNTTLMDITIGLSIDEFKENIAVIQDDHIFEAGFFMLSAMLIDFDHVTFSHAQDETPNPVLDYKCAKYLRKIIEITSIYKQEIRKRGLMKKEHLEDILLPKKSDKGGDSHGITL